MHTELALDAIDFLKRDNHKVVYTTDTNQRESLWLDSPYFKTEIIVVDGEMNIQTAVGLFVVLMAAQGDSQISVDGTNYALPFWVNRFITSMFDRIYRPVESTIRSLDGHHVKGCQINFRVPIENPSTTFHIENLRHRWTWKLQCVQETFRNLWELG